MLARTTSSAGSANVLDRLGDAVLPGLEHPGQRGDGDAPLGLDVLSHRGQRRFEPGRERVVVEAHDRQVVGHAEAAAWAACTTLAA